jgi:hypothetical protein
MERREENISNHNEEQSFLFSLLQKMTQIIEDKINNNDVDISLILASIFSEFININPEPIHPQTIYVIRWSDTIIDEMEIPHVLQYEIEFIPELHEDIIEKAAESKSIRETTSHLPSYRKLKENDQLIIDGEYCPICHDVYIVGEYKRTLTNCGHNFHKKCIDKWFVSNPTLECPMCRTSYKKIVI